MANKYKYVCTVFTLFGTAPACVRGSGQRISCMSGTRYRSPDSRPSAGVSRARGRAGCWRIRKGGVPVCRKPGARVCLSGSRGGQSDADTGVGRPESGGADECRDAFGLPACLPGNAGACHPNRDVGLPERGACCGCGRSAVLARKNEGSPERLPSPSKINP